MACEGKPAQCLMRRKRSSSAAATSLPSFTNAAEESAWNALRPRMITGSFSRRRSQVRHRSRPRSPPSLHADRLCYEPPTPLSSAVLGAIRRRASGELAQLCFQHHEGKHRLGHHALECIEDPGAPVENETLAEQAVEKHCDRHERRPEPQPAYQSIILALVDPCELALHVARLADDPLPGRLPIVVNDVAAERRYGTVHVPRLRMPFVPHRKMVLSQQNGVGGIERRAKLVRKNRIIEPDP